MPVAWFAHQNVPRRHGHLFPVDLADRFGHRIEDLGLNPVVMDGDDVAFAEGDLLQE
jgi:hypothetical protein